MNRRDFIKVCSSVALISSSLLPSLLNAKETNFKAYKKAILVKRSGEPLKPEDIDPSKQYLFFYPYRATPCILINLGTEVPPQDIKLSDGTTYRWNGGVGPKKSIVAFCAICPHQFSYPNPDFSMINYYPPGVKSKLTKKDRIIQCCAHMSVFDPSKGGAVLEGPAEYPLTIIVLSYENGNLYALGTLGKEFYEDFFDIYKPDLRRLYKSTRKAKKLMDRCEVIEMEEYVNEVIRC